MWNYYISYTIQYVIYPTTYFEQDFGVFRLEYIYDVVVYTLHREESLS